MALNAGSSSSIEGSMAAAIEQAFKEEWPNIMKTDAPEPNPQMQLLFIAVAKGVVRHLVANAGSFKVKISGLEQSVSLSIDIESTNS